MTHGQEGGCACAEQSEAAQKSSPMRLRRAHPGRPALPVWSCTPLRKLNGRTAAEFTTSQPLTDDRVRWRNASA